jgi:hypothetical protein
MNDDGSIVPVFFLAFVIWTLWPGSGDSWNDKLWRSIRYGVSYGQVRVDSKPADCNFLQAPLGIKGCSYEAKVTAYNSFGSAVGGDNAPKYSKDTKTGRTIISFNDGQTWDWFD